MGFMQSLNKENISIEFYLEVNKIFMVLNRTIRQIIYVLLTLALLKKIFFFRLTCMY